MEKQILDKLDAIANELIESMTEEEKRNTLQGMVKHITEDYVKLLDHTFSKLGMGAEFQNHFLVDDEYYWQVAVKVQPMTPEEFEKIKVS